MKENILWFTNYSYAFSDCTGLSTIELPEGVTSIGEEVFSGCTGLSAMELPAAVTSIGGGAFSGCTGLSAMELPDAVTSIGDGAFEDCEGFISIEIPENVTSIGKNIFMSCGSLQSIEVNENNQSYSSKDGVLFNKDKTMLLAYPGGKSGAYTVPESVTSLGGRAFYDCDGLTEIKIIGKVDAISRYAFSDCNNLVSVELPEGMTEIRDFAFENCYSIKSLVIPEGVLSIGEYVFENCTNLTSVTLPESLERMGYDIFMYCRRLETVRYNGTEAQLEEVENYFFNLINVYVYFMPQAEYTLNADGTLALTVTPPSNAVSDTAAIYAAAAEPGGEITAVDMSGASGTAEMSIPAENAELVRIFIWDENMQPLSVMREIKLR